MSHAICKKVLYSGRVQGVGFRYKANRIAMMYVVVGYVKNLANGQVEMLVEGEESEVNKVLSRVADQMALNIEHITITDQELTGRTQFEILFS